MDVYYFLEKRLDFIQKYYDSAAISFKETLRKIESEEHPFESPYSEDGEPAFMDEWTEATAGLEVLGRSGISMLSEALKLFFKTCASELGLSPLKTHKKSFDNGFVSGYRALFGDALGLNWDECPADFSILEQIVLARNVDQHGGDIVTTRVEHTEWDTKKFSSLFFASDKELEIYRSMDVSAQIWMTPTVHVSATKLSTAIGEVKGLANWLDSKIWAAKALRREAQVAAYTTVINTIRGKVDAAEDEAAMAATFHESWKPTAYDQELHKRIGASYAGHTFLVVRTALRRELLIALMRLWDTDRFGRAIGLDAIGKTLSDDLFFDALVKYRAARLKMDSPFAESQVRQSLLPGRNETIELIRKYTDEGPGRRVLTDLKRMRNEQLAHRQTTPTEVARSSATDHEIEEFYQDNLKIVGLLLHVVLGRAFDLSEVGGVYEHHAKYFWAAVRGERTAGHPNFRATNA